MEGEVAASATVYMEYIDSPAIAERLTTSASEGLAQESNIDLTTRVSPNSQCPAASELPTLMPTIASPINQHPASELPTLIPRDESSIQLVCTERSPRSKLRSSIQHICGNWRTGLEVSILTGIIIMVWGLFSIPTILYALPPQIREV